ncbi:MAG: D-alanyl-D-alanine carboxypeptidase [Clostridiales bacterium]|nr:D-alanyl-D-alanine carboxypeptidase [Clostridiales bacterium]
MSKRTNRRYRINKQGQMLIAGIVIVILIIFVIIVAKACANNSDEGSAVSSGDDVVNVSDGSETSEDPANAKWTSVETEAAPSYLNGLNADIFSDIYSKQAVLIHAGSGKVVASKDGDTKGFPASVTKMMTAIVAIENIPDINTTYTMPVEIYDTLYKLDLSTAGFAKNDTVSVKDLLYGLLMRSGAECCLALENIVAGGSDAFVAKMNEKAAEIGMYNTHFANSTGEHDVNHYSTPHDMAILMDYALKNQTFRDIISTSNYRTAPLASNSEGIEFYSTLYQATPDMSQYASKFSLKGGKTGYTSDAGQCLATYAVINGEEYILVTFGAYKFEGAPTSHLHARDHINIYSAFADAISDI